MSKPDRSATRTGAHANSVAAVESASLTHRRRRSRRQHALTGFAFLLPAALLFAFFELFSLAYNLYISFHEWRGFGDPRFVGLRNYADLLTDQAFLAALLNNVIFIAVALGVMTVMSLFFAIVLDSGIPGAGFFRALLFLPVVIPMVVVSLVWARVYAARGGLLNQFLEAFGLGHLSHDWLGDPNTALGALLVVWVWRHMGYGAVLFGAGLMGIPEEIKDAATLDGAGPWQTVWHVVLPLLRPIIFVVGILYTIFALKVFTLVFLMTGGGPFHATEVMNTYLYTRVFRYFELGIGSAVTMIAIAFVALFSILRRRFQSAAEF